MVVLQTELNTGQAVREQRAPDARVRQLAESHALVKTGRGVDLPLLQSPDQCDAFLRAARQHFARIAEQELTVSYAGEWLLDNFYIVQQALRQVVEDIPAGFYADLPKLVRTALPRVYALARELTRWTGNPFMPAELEDFVIAYQDVTPLTMGELWALPAMLRLVNLENLTYALGQLAGLKDVPPLSPDAHFPDFPLDETVVANAIINLRTLATQDWKTYFEAVSRVEQILRQDAVYARMDFETRNRYRRVIEQLVSRSGQAEEDAARTVISLAQRDSPDGRSSHIGYYLLDEGRRRLEAELDYRPPWPVRLSRAVPRYPTFVYLGSIAVLTALVLLAVGVYVSSQGGSPWGIFVSVLLALIPASAVGVGVVNWLINLIVPPAVLPKMDFDDGIPEDCRTMVVIPALLSDVEEVNSLCQQLEQHYLRNNDPHLSFALLLDFPDAPQQHMPDDAALVEHGRSRIQSLNQRYRSRPFYFFLRERRWNPAENTWMGWERKRGKLGEFNKLILDRNASTSYIVQDGDLRVLPHIRYVITLDADTVLPMNSAHALVGTLAHPLNRAQFDGDQITSGYTILQPRVEIAPPAANRSWFTRIFAGDTGLDLYTLAVSDVYQDWFGEGSYTGKGIYDVAAFERSLAGRIPENRLLSHDLFEGIHGRVALVTDVVLLEDYPPHYLVHSRRLHRWIRGDWQLLPWLMPRVPCADGSATLNPLSALDRWKILDNLRRSLLMPALLVLLLAGWFGLPGSPLVWTFIVLLASAVPFVTSALNQIFQLIRGASMRTIRDTLAFDGLRWLLALVFLPHEAFLALDAITTTLWRLARHQRLLQWTSAAHTARLFGDEMDAGVVWRYMFTSVVFAVGVGLLVALVNPTSLPVAAPFLAVWLLSPEIARRLSRPVIRPQPPLSDEQRQTLRSLARRTWLFFERYVGPEDHWLPPDHFQETPRGIIAHHTSPTNIGLLLLSTLAAYDLGYMGLLELSTRLQLTFEALEKLERHRGHFLNWYDTRTLEPLLPRYVSTVDSGNLACCLLVLQQALQEFRRAAIMRPQRWQGLLDTLALLEATLVEFEPDETHTWIEALLNSLADIRAQIAAVQDDPTVRSRYVDTLLGEVWPEFSRLLVEALDEARDAFDATHLAMLRIYAERVQHHLHNMQRDASILLPWLSLLANPPALFSDPQTPPAILEAWTSLLDAMPLVPRVEDVMAVYETAQATARNLRRRLASAGDDAPVQEARGWCDRLMQALDAATDGAENLLATLSSLDQQIETYLATMDFQFLFDSSRKVFHIGYNVSHERLDNSYYDLLASEARMASLFAIAMRQIPQEHWLHLARPYTAVRGVQTLLSWSGTMFEYLMPVLLVRSYPDTLLHQSNEAATSIQMAYARDKSVPWGISESGYYGFDAHQNYQYRAFGVPDIALKRGQAAELVVSPYASLLALALRPQAVMQNIELLQDQGALGVYGFYEAIDYTRSRLPLGQQQAVVREYMAHHQGMILVALVNYLHNPGMVARFHANPRIQSAELLLEEQIPRQPEFQYPSLEDGSRVSPEQPQINTAPWRVPVETPAPRVHYLSNGRYGLMVTNAGGGYSQWQSNALTRWRADTTLDDWGMWIYLRDQESGAVWPACAQPMGSGHDEALFYPHKIEFQRRDHDISVQLEITVPPSDDLEIRRLRLTNQGDEPRRLLVSSYAEVALAPHEADGRHAAFNKLFIESEYLPRVNGLLFRRRPRSEIETPIFALHMLVTETQQQSSSMYETDRARFLGRSRTPSAPAALVGEKPDFTNTTGATLDPIMALAQEVEIEPHSSVQLAYVTVAAETRAKALALARTYRIWSTLERAFDQARYQFELEMRQLELHSEDIEQIQKMLSGLLYPQPALRADPATLVANTRSQPGLWAFGISGDYPIVLLRIGDEQEIGLVRDLVRAHTFWRNREIKITLVILNQRDTGYTQELYNQVHHLIVRMGSAAWINRHDGIFLLRADLLSEADQALLAASARVFLDGRRGTLAHQLAALDQQPVYLPPFVPALPDEPAEPTPPLARPENLVFDNGYGGFSPDGREYLIYLHEGSRPPAPWLNVIANPDFGLTVSESGGGYTWAVNSSENRLTAWRNDSVTDMPSEALYLRDEETGRIWSPTPLPAPASAPYLVRHGAGYSICEHHSHGLRQRTSWFVPTDSPVKVTRLRLENTWTRARRITVTCYAEWVLGTTRDVTQQYIIPEFDPATQALLFRNPYSIEFGGQVAFISASKDFHGLTTDRTEFLGRLGSLKRPAALGRIGLSSNVQAGLDPCAAVQLHVDLQPGEVEEVFFIIGAGETRDAALQLTRQYRDPAQVEAAWQEATQFWEAMRTSITVNTPEPAMNVVLPWLLYQALACRIWGRSALYQSSGAYGFRDQLQDVMALIHTRPDIAREHILRAARHQFEAGDVLHWWHPPSGRGVRTRFSDDLIWLPFVTAQYVAATGDQAILQEQVPFLKGEPLKPEEDERYNVYEPTGESYSLYDHCRRALNKGQTAGSHELPLMGSGDWNDGMNRVGIEGRGESVWVGWFLYATMTAFLDLCEHMEDSSQAAAYRLRLGELQQALEENAWDGDWYLRAFYDDGTPLGSSRNTECRIDSIAQSWSVISRAADPERARRAMDSVLTHLLMPDDQLLLLFTPPFDKTPKDPGYIKGYPPGIRENGGQYTHAAIWAAWALAQMGDGDRAEALFRLLNPIYHSDTPEKADRYRVEPYVIAADVYSAPPHTGRGGWTWYTGSSGWMYRLGIEAILGVRREGEYLRIDPCIPSGWPSYELTYRYGQAVYKIRVENPQGVNRGVRQVTVDNQLTPDGRIPLVDDERKYDVVVTMG